MSANDFSRLEDEKQFFDVNRHDIVNYVKETVLNNMEDALESLGHKLTSVYEPEAVKTFSGAVLGAYRVALQNRSKEIEQVVSDYFAIDPRIVHPDDQIHEGVTDEEEARLDRQIEAEERKFMALCEMERKMKNILNSTLKSGDVFEKILERSIAAGELQNATQLMVSSLENIPLDQIFNDMNLKP